jgi:hypothetical protein
MVNVLTGRGHRVAALVLLAPSLAGATILACSSSHSNTSEVDVGPMTDATALDASLDGDAPAEAETGPNLVPGDCVFENNVWYCGAGYGNYPGCPEASGYPLLGEPCDFDDGGYCVGCMQGVAMSFSCQYGSYTIGSTVGHECNH